MCFDGFKLYSMIAGVGLPMIVFFSQIARGMPSGKAEQMPVP